jgi:2-haloacid dehalogenase
MLQDFKAITFDCYGTLIDWERGILDQLRPWLDRNGRRDLPDATVVETYARLEAQCEAETPTALYPAIIEEVHARLTQQWELTPDPVAARAFGQSVGDWPAFPDTAAALQYLKQFFKLVILSNVDRASFARSNEKLGVAFDLVLTAQDIGAYKPSRRNFEAALSQLDQRFGIAKSQLLHAACSVFHDIVPATAMGITTAWVNRRNDIGTLGQTARPTYEVADMAGLVALHKT